jgi:hypothetical protein
VSFWQQTIVVLFLFALGAAVFSVLVRILDCLRAILRLMDGDE